LFDVSTVSRAPLTDRALFGAEVAVAGWNSAGKHVVFTVDLMIYQRYITKVTTLGVIPHLIQTASGVGGLVSLTGLLLGVIFVKKFPNAVTVVASERLTLVGHQARGAISITDVEELLDNCESGNQVSPKAVSESSRE